MSFFRDVFGKKEQPCCDIKIVEVKDNQEECCVQTKHKEACCEGVTENCC